MENDVLRPLKSRGPWRWLWILPLFLGLLALSWLLVFPLWWLAQASPDLYTIVMLGLLILVVGALVYLRLRKSWKGLSGRRILRERVTPALVKILVACLILANGVFSFAAWGSPILWLQIVTSALWLLLLISGWLISRRRKAPHPKESEEEEGL